MQILVVGFRKSGVDILRRILSTHPQISATFLKKQLMNKYSTIEDVSKYVERNIDIFLDNWIESVSFYESIEGTSPVEYCRKWNRYFGSTARIIHIIRHPVDAALTLAKQENDGSVNDHLKVYKNIMRFIVPKIANIENSFTVKYEDLLLKPDEMLYDLFDFCNLKPDIDFRAALLKKNNPRFINSLDTSGVFIHEYKKRLRINVNMNSVYQVINNKIGGELYKQICK